MSSEREAPRRTRRKVFRRRPRYVRSLDRGRCCGRNGSTENGKRGGGAFSSSWMLLDIAGGGVGAAGAGGGGGWPWSQCVSRVKAKGEITDRGYARNSPPLHAYRINS